ncbi:MAG: hypothetical protein KKG99_11805 [Bacteroidetes bacterium]|nr:hypothetical protein [Bacteroidota bacterium]
MKRVWRIIGILIIIVVVSAVIKRFFFHPNVYPFKAWVFAWAGDTKVIESSTNTISKIELKRLRNLIRPGDIFLNRSDYYISNIGIPGFWTHAGFYIGTTKEREELFNNDIACADWVKTCGVPSGNLEDLLQHKFDLIYEANRDKRNEKNIIEAKSEGVILSSFTEGAQKDGIVVLRPIISKREVAEAIYKTFGFVSKPYDYNFDFSTDTEIACTELVYRAYENSNLFPLSSMFGKPFITANEIAEYYDSNYGNPELKLSLIYIYNGENGYTAENDTAHLIFRKSWNESLW